MTEAIVKRYGMGKLVRDLMPDIMTSEGFCPCQRKLNNHEYIYELKRKLLEEAEEAVGATTTHEIIEEIGDVLEVIHSIANSLSIPFQEFEDCRLKKTEKRGGFKDRLYVEYVETTKNNPHIERFSAHPKRYPELSAVDSNGSISGTSFVA